MTATDTEDGLHAALDDNPADQGLRLVLADLYDETGRPDWADCLRWMAAKGRYPDRPGEATDAGGHPLCPDVWRFWEGIIPHNPKHARLPGILAEHMRPLPSFAANGRRDLEEKLCRAWGRATPAWGVFLWDVWYEGWFHPGTGEAI